MVLSHALGKLRYVAITNQRAAAAQMLLKRGAEKEINLPGSSLLHMALEKNLPDVAQADLASVVRTWLRWGIPGTRNIAVLVCGTQLWEMHANT